MLKDVISGLFAGGCSGAACVSAGAPLRTIAIAVVLAAIVTGVLLFRARPTRASAFARRRAHDHLIPATPTRFRARRA